MDLLESLASGGSYPALTLDDELRLSVVIQNPTTKQQKKDDAIMALILGNRHFIRLFVRRYCRPGHPQYEDTLADALAGATVAAQRYRPKLENPARYISYASFWMRQRILENIYDQRGASVPSGMRKLLRQYRDFVDTYQDLHQKDPSSDTIKQALEIDDENLTILRDLTDETISMNNPLAQYDGIALETAIPVKEEIEDEVQRLFNEELVHTALSKLHARQRRMIQYWIGMLDGNEHSLEEVGFQFGLVRQQVSTLLARACQLFRQEVIRHY